MTAPTGWTQEGGSLVREWQVKDFSAAVLLVSAIAIQANNMNHHPDVTIHGYNKVRVSITTHDTGGLTDKDSQLADQLNKVIPE